MKRNGRISARVVLSLLGLVGSLALASYFVSKGGIFNLFPKAAEREVVRTEWAFDKSLGGWTGTQAILLAAKGGNLEVTPNLANFDKFDATIRSGPVSVWLGSEQKWVKFRAMFEKLTGGGCSGGLAGSTGSSKGGPSPTCAPVTILTFPLAVYYTYALNGTTGWQDPVSVAVTADGEWHEYAAEINKSVRLITGVKLMLPKETVLSGSIQWQTYQARKVKIDWVRLSMAVPESSPNPNPKEGQPIDKTGILYYRSYTMKYMLQVSPREEYLVRAAANSNIDLRKYLNRKVEVKGTLSLSPGQSNVTVISPELINATSITAVDDKYYPMGDPPPPPTSAPGSRTRPR